jgi:hypothetical protein
MCKERPFVLHAQWEGSAYEVGPELLARAKLPAAPAGMAFGGEAGPDPAAFDIMNTDDFGIWQNMTMDTRHGAVAVEASIPGCVHLQPCLLCIQACFTTTWLWGIAEGCNSDSSFGAGGNMPHQAELHVDPAGMPLVHATLLFAVHIEGHSGVHHAHADGCGHGDHDHAHAGDRTHASPGGNRQAC